MSVSPSELLFYAGALLVLFLTPGPVWMAMIARGLSSGFAGAFPVALGVSIGDALWPVVAVLGVSWVVSEFAGFMALLRWVAAVTFLAMGVLLIRHAGRPIGTDGRLTRPGALAGFLAGVAVILGNPKAILFYMGVLPGFFDLRSLTAWDVAAISLLSVAVPLFGNTVLALFIHRARRLLATPERVRRLNVTSGALLILVGVVIPFT